MCGNTVSWRRSMPVVAMETSSSWQRRGSDAWGLAAVSTPARVRRLWRNCCSRTRTVSAVTPTCWITPTERAPAKQRVISLYRTATCLVPDRVCRSLPCTLKQLTSASPVNKTQLSSYNLCYSGSARLKWKSGAGMGLGEDQRYVKIYLW